MPTLGHHSKHLRILVLAQTDRTCGVITAGVIIVTVIISSTVGILGEEELGVGVDDRLVKANDEVFVRVRVLVIVLGDKDNAREDDAIGGGGGGGVRVVVGVVARAEVGEVVGGGGGGGGGGHLR
ncbi:hypothetical protein CFOL_v3_13413 [Cephalotus follicularis]|uniref:Uncharacterized protein n=1 Tax=Cephalotus follicularis TaxID=3775 RepID=A0A1Q3BQD8_CEPFO|nr:hypothetical protein CFOL_v3_13413 [Cephalotus follicularis]